NTNTQQPQNISALLKIAGTGNSEVVKYEGYGAYFLDKLEDGIWRLEVLPDAILIDNPFGKNNLEKTVSVINWHKWNMTINLQDLETNFTARSLNVGNSFKPEVKGSSFTVQPGTYILSRKDLKTSFTGNEKW